MALGNLCRLVKQSFWHSVMLDQDLEIQIKAARLAAEEDREQSLQLRRHLGRSQKSITSLQQMVGSVTDLWLTPPSGKLCGCLREDMRVRVRSLCQA